MKRSDTDKALTNKAEFQLHDEANDTQEVMGSLLGMHEIQTQLSKLDIGEEGVELIDTSSTATMIKNIPAGIVPTENLMQLSSVQDIHIANLEEKLFEAVIDGDLKMVKYLVEGRHVKLDVHDNDIVSPLFAAAAQGNLQTVKYLAYGSDQSSLISHSDNNMLAAEQDALDVHMAGEHEESE